MAERCVSRPSPIAFQLKGDKMKKAGYDHQLRMLEKIAPAGYVLGLHIRYNSATLMFRTYPEEWMDVYTQNGYMQSDPLVVSCNLIP